MERQLAQVRAEAAAEIAAAHTERDEARGTPNGRRGETAGPSEETRAARGTDAADAAQPARRRRPPRRRSRRAGTGRAGRRGGPAARRDASAAEALRAQAERDRDAARRESAALRDDVAAVTQERDAARRGARDGAGTRGPGAGGGHAGPRPRRTASQEVAQARAAAADAAADAERSRAEVDRSAGSGTRRARRPARLREELDRRAWRPHGAGRDGRAAAQLRAEAQRAREAAAEAQARQRGWRHNSPRRPRRDQAQQRVAKLTGQVSDLAAALANLGAAGRVPAGLRRFLRRGTGRISAP